MMTHDDRGRGGVKNCQNGGDVICGCPLKLPRVFGSLINGSYSLITAAKLINLVVYPFTDIGPCICKAC